MLHTYTLMLYSKYIFRFGRVETIIIQQRSQELGGALTRHISRLIYNFFLNDNISFK